MIIGITGGLGNQLFEYAFGIAMARKYQKELELDLFFYEKHPERKFELDSYKIAYAKKGIYDRYNKVRLYIQRIPVLSELAGIIKEKREYEYDARVDKRAYKFYAGYWQNIKYLKQNKSFYQESFTYQGPFEKNEKEIAEKMQNEESVSIHIRRGDYLNKQYKDVYCSQKVSYYHKAMEYLMEKLKGKDLQFYFFSDDIEWCRMTFSSHSNATFIDTGMSTNQHTDLWLMRKCKHSIIANSTFSWWGAWLKDNPDGIVIAPKNWYYDQKKNERLLNALMEPEWVVIDDI